MPEIQMPKLSDTMTEGTVVSWKKNVGDQVSAGEVLAEIETDKATMEWEATDDGVLKEIYVQEGGKVNVGERIAFIGNGDEAPAENKTETEKPAPAEAEEPAAGPPTPSKKTEPAPEKRESASVPKEKSASNRVKASPLARKIAEERNLDLTKIKGS